MGLVRDCSARSSAGGLVDLAGWRSIFLINLPIGAFAFVVAAKFLPSSKPTARSRRLDVGGVLLAAVGHVHADLPAGGRVVSWAGRRGRRACWWRAVAVLAGFGV